MANAQRGNRSKARARTTSRPTNRSKASSSSRSRTSATRRTTGTGGDMGRFLARRLFPVLEEMAKRGWMQDQEIGKLRTRLQHVQERMDAVTPARPGVMAGETV